MFLRPYLGRISHTDLALNHGRADEKNDRNSITPFGTCRHFTEKIELIKHHAGTFGHSA